MDLALKAPLKVKARFCSKVGGTFKGAEAEIELRYAMPCLAFEWVTFSDLLMKEYKSNSLWLIFGDSSSFKDQLLPDLCNDQAACVTPSRFIPTEFSCHRCQYLVCSKINGLAVHL